MFAQDYYYDVFLNMELFQLPYYNQLRNVITYNSHQI